MKVLRCKVLLLGAACVGKSALAQMFHSDGAGFPKAYAMTSGAEFAVKRVSVPDADAVVELYVFDIAGADIFRELAKQYMAGTSAVVLAYDVTNPESFHDLPAIVDAVIPFMPHGTLLGALVACKSDLETRAVVKPQDGEAFAKHHNLDFFQTSAKENKNVEAVFQAIARAFCTAYEEALAGFSQ